ncbi:methylglyoxal synthase [Oricola sp.]|uniref:methylglyoxal synthase n=1 Tax=Oricola sp. TaxID=1979950 RepID=UPI003BAB9B76
MGGKRCVALVAHDQKKDDLVDFVTDHREQLSRFELVATGTTGGRVNEACPELSVRRLKSGPLGGDQQIGAMIANGEIEFVIFFVDPLTPMPHDVDVKALMRLAIVYDIALALNRSTALFLLASLTGGTAQEVSIDG